VKCELYGNVHGPYLCLLTILAQIFEPLRSGPFDTAPWDAGDDACQRLSSSGLARALWKGETPPKRSSAVADKDIIKAGKKAVVILRRNGLESEP
jgi:hypothetical protein